MSDPKSASPFTIAIYNPALLKKEDLIRGFMARQPLLDRLLDELRREQPGSTPQHQLIIGQRGFGKTTLLRRLAFGIEDEPGLAATWMPLVFPEEQYNVAGLADFWLNCVDALSDALDRTGNRAASQALDSRVERVPAAGAERSGAALNLLLEEADRIGRRFLLLVDNIDIVLDRLKKDEEWEFRRVIAEERRLHFVGSSSRVLEALYEHGRAFYDFFQVHELKGLDETETFTTLCRLAEQAGNAEVARLVREQSGRIKAVRVLTGGNPRTLVLLFKVLAQGPEGDVQRDIEQLLDEYTALYKARFEELAPQAQQLVDAMAIHWDPLTAADLTELLRPLSVNHVSAQLKRLEDFGVVEKTPWFGEKKNAFQIAERFFNIWYLMRASRRVRRRLVWLVKFLEAWFDREEDQFSGPNQEAAEAFLRAFEIDPERSWDLDSFIQTCNRLAESPAELPTLLKMAQKAHELAPDHPQTQFLLARILTALGRWPEASQLLEQLAANESAFFSNDFFRTALKTGHLDEVIVILERTGANDRWRPLYEALRAARVGTPDYLRTVAPEIRVAAMKILRDLDPSLFPDGEPGS